MKTETLFSRLLIGIIVVILISLILKIFIIPRYLIMSHPVGNSASALEAGHVYATTSLQFLDDTGKRPVKEIQVELAEIQAEQLQGLSGQKSLAADHGMLFVFEKSDIYGFWMPNMLFSIDIMWINSQKKIVHIEKNISPDSYPTVFKPKEEARYVLEVPAGFSEQNVVSVGDSVNFILP